MIVICEDDYPKVFYSAGLVGDNLGFCLSGKSVELKSNLCCWKIKGHENCFVAGWGQMRAIDIVKYEDNLLKNGDIDYEYLSSVVCSKISQILYKEGFLKEENDSWGTEFVIVYGNKAYCLSDGLVRRIENYKVFGDYVAVVSVILEKMVGQDIKNIIKEINDTFYKLYHFTLYPFVVLDTKTKKFNIINGGNV